MKFDLAHILQSMGPLSKGIAAVLLLMGIVAIGITIERTIVLVRSRAATRRFVAGARRLLAQRDFDGVASLAGDHKASFVARLAGNVVARHRHAAGDDGALAPIERARRAALRRREAIGADMRRGLPALASVGSVAPFVGLLGTVVGIITAFQGIAATGSGGLGAVSAGIAEALIETAFGLGVAIPAVLFFNYLSTKIQADEAIIERFSGELLDEMENAYGDSGEYRVAKAA